MPLDPSVMYAIPRIATAASTSSSVNPA
jgi:hypothetical protein